MKYYCGIDLHVKDCFICVIDEKEKTLVRKRLPNSLHVMLEILSKFDPKPTVVVESTLNWY